MTELLRVYAPEECTEPGRQRGYPFAWDECPGCQGLGRSERPAKNCLAPRCALCEGTGSIKAMVRALADGRCLRCRHPYRNGIPGNGEWSPCDHECRHQGPFQWRPPQGTEADIRALFRRGVTAGQLVADGYTVTARWRVLTVHHLNEVKADCRWWNLVALCQRCHLNVQSRVKLDRPWPFDHSEWFKPYAAGYYASSILAEELDREQTTARLDELLALEHKQDRLPGVAA